MAAFGWVRIGGYHLNLDHVLSSRNQEPGPSDITSINWVSNSAKDELGHLFVFNTVELLIQNLLMNMYPAEKNCQLDVTKPLNRIDQQATETQLWKEDLLVLQEDLNSIIEKLSEHQRNISKHQERLHRYQYESTQRLNLAHTNYALTERHSESGDQNLKGELIAKHRQLAEYHQKLTTVVRLLTQTI